ncbi:hypothetical protein BUALT_Bualt13G0116500 [Buddleja alternifolia]|uniref:Cytochrome P450 n=1 Tax=Buddleja alternifolia TaxID=168488 RepID=A0AAV6WXL0_9LAMI|nr:hypothetical protein BUALT_Bualt13G0116500 [Buddleja alternifolia]
MNILLLHIREIISTLLFLSFLYKLWTKYTQKATHHNSSPPQPFGAWPIIGHLPLLGNKIHLSRTLANLSDKYGPIFTLRLGMQNAVVVSSREAVSECFTTNDKFFASRPKSSSGEYLVYDYASFGFANGPYWREMRKLVTLEVLSARRLESMKNLRVSEIATSVRELYVGTKGKWPCKVNISRWIDQVALNIIVKTIAGKRYGNNVGGGEDVKEVENFRTLIREFTYLSGEFVISDVIPIRVLKWMDVQGHIKSMKRVSKELDGIIEKWIDEHVKCKRDEQDFLDVMLSTIDDKFMDSDGPPRLTIIKATVVVSCIINMDLCFEPGFDLAAPGNRTVDMDEGIGITMPRVNPLEVVITPRLEPQLYEN